MGYRKLRIFYRQLATMIDSGMGVAQCARMMSGDVYGRALQEAAEKISAVVARGGTLSDGMKLSPDVFPALHVSIIKTGEKSGGLDESFKRLAGLAEKAYGDRVKLVLGILYPAILVHLAVLIPAVPLLFAGGLTAFMRAVLGVFVPVYAAGGGGWYLFRQLRKNPWIRRVLDAFLLKLPVAGRIAYRACIADFARALSSLYGAGMGIVEALKEAAAATGNVVMQEKIMRAVPVVEAGGGLTRALEVSGAFPGVVYQMLQTGEQSGKIDEVLDKLADYYEEQNDTAKRTIMIVLPVVCFLGVAGYIGYIVVSFYVGYFSKIGTATIFFQTR